MGRGLSESRDYNLVHDVGHGGSFTAVVRRVLFHIRFRLYYPSLDLYHHSLGTPVRGQFLMYIRALRATLNQTDRSFNSVSLYKSASYMSFVIPAWLTRGSTAVTKAPYLRGSTTMTKAPYLRGSTAVTEVPYLRGSTAVTKVPYLSWA